ncbi:hypothetical protein [Lysobacter gummosus]|uniref:hypothetical protein n=1 Tax=Lysobacter gummosus TaxID=262324 RepID=UPI0036412ACD
MTASRIAVIAVQARRAAVSAGPRRCEENVARAPDSALDSVLPSAAPGLSRHGGVRTQRAVIVGRDGRSCGCSIARLHSCRSNRAAKKA